MAAHARLKNEFTENEKYHNFMTWLVYFSGNKTVNTYKQLKQIPSDDDIDSSGEEYTVFDKDDRSTIQLQLVPSGTENRKRPTEEVNIKSVKTNWRQCLLLLGVIVVALCGLTLGIVLVRFVQGPVESRLDTVKVITNNSTQSQTETSKPVTEATKGVTESKYEEDVTLNSEETVKWQKTWKDICKYDKTLTASNWLDLMYMYMKAVRELQLHKLLELFIFNLHLTANKDSYKIKTERTLCIAL